VMKATWPANVNPVSFAEVFYLTFRLQIVPSTGGWDDAGLYPLSK
jgi:hypothetical protein